MPARRLLDIALLAALTVFGVSLATDAEPDDGPLHRALARAAGPRPLRDAAGARAHSPADIPARGWWQILKRVVNQIGEDRVMAEAAGVTFYMLLAIFPAIASLISIYGLIANPNTIGQHLSLAAGVIPDGGMQLITDQVKSLTAQPPKALGFGLIIGIATSLWSANAGIKSLMDALNAVYEEKETRSYLRRTLISFAFTLGTLVFIILAITAVVVLPTVLSFIGFNSNLDTLLSLARWPLMLVAIAFLLAFLYRYGPSRAKAKWQWLSWGSSFAAITWVLASVGFSYYVANFGSYNKTYGSLGAAVGFMTWIWISTIIVLVGAELNAEMEHQTAEDTTAGPAKPRGLRGARKANEVAAA
jgi:membrane protein